MKVTETYNSLEIFPSACITDHFPEEVVEGQGHRDWQKFHGRVVDDRKDYVMALLSATDFLLYL